MSFYVYILLCMDGSFYTGYTNDLQERTRQHENGKGAKYTKSHPPPKSSLRGSFRVKKQRHEKGKGNKKVKSPTKTGPHSVPRAKNSFRDLSAELMLHP